MNLRLALNRWSRSSLKRRIEYRRGILTAAALVFLAGAAGAKRTSDGHPDVIAAYKNDVIQIWIDAGDGSFRNETRARLGAVPHSKNGIRRLGVFGEALVITRTGDAPLIRMDRGKGIFSDPEVNLPDPLWVVVPGDFNQDGYLDLMFGQGGAVPLVSRFGKSPL